MLSNPMESIFSHGPAHLACEQVGQWENPYSSPLAHHLGERVTGTPKSDYMLDLFLVL